MVKKTEKQTKLLYKKIVTNLCPEKSYWYEGCQSHEESFWELITYVADRMDFEQVYDFLQTCKKGNFTDEQIDIFYEACDEAGECGVLFSNLSISKQDLLPELLRQTREKFFSDAEDSDDENKKTKDELSKQIDELLKRYNYMKLGEYYFFRAAFDDPYYDFEANDM